MFGNCSLESYDNTVYSGPVPWVGLYMAAASLICFLGLSMDLLYSLRHGKIWIASNFFSLNAATLTVVAVATKLPSDITTPTPGSFDRLSKLSAIALLCVVMNHMTPSLGHMSRMGIVSNMVALGILVLTIFINLSIQFEFATGTLFKIKLVFGIPMVFLFFTLVTYSLTVPTIMRIQEEKYNSKHKNILNGHVASVGLDGDVSTKKLLSYLDKYWLMALTSSPDYTMRCLSLPIFCSWLGHAIVIFFLQFFIPPILLFTRHGADGYCLLGSDYKWSIPPILFTQTATILVGTVVSLLRSSNTGLDHMVMGLDELFRIESHWIQLLVEWRETPLSLGTSGRKVRMFTNAMKNCLLYVSLGLQIGVIMSVKALLFLFTCFYYYFLAFPIILVARLIFFLPKRVIQKVGRWGCCSSSRVNVQESTPPDELKEYVLQLEGQGRMMPAHKVVLRWWKQPRSWIARGRRQQPANLLKFLRCQTTNEGFSNIAIPTMVPEESPKSYALPLATLAAIARAMLREQDEPLMLLMCAVREGMRYARFIERNMSFTESNGTARDAADIVWEGVDLYHRWLKVDLDKLVVGKIESCIVKKLSDLARREFGDASPLKCSPEVLAAYCMSKATDAILLIDGDVHEMQELVFEWLERMIAVVLRECLSNLPQAILKECYRRKFGDREEGVREAAIVLGEAEQVLIHLKILKITEMSSISVQ